MGRERVTCAAGESRDYLRCLLPGPESLVAPEWVPWSDRIRPGDLGVGDVLPADDARLVPGMSGSDEIDAIIDRDEPRGWTGWKRAWVERGVVDRRS